jgi:dihydroneopterin aldolase
MATIALEGMIFQAFHGCMEEEKVTGNTFRVDLFLETDTSAPEFTDQLKDTLNYSEAYRIVKEQMEIPSKLLEHVGRRILNALKQNFPEIELAEIKVSKLHPPISGEIKSVSVTINEIYE